MGPGLSKPLYTIFSNVKVLKMFSCHVGFSIQLKHTVFWQSASSKKNFVPMNNDAISKVPWSLVCHIFSEISLVGWSLLKLQCETIDSFFISYRYRIIIGRSRENASVRRKRWKSSTKMRPGGQVELWEQRVHDPIAKRISFLTYIPTGSTG